jgi:hypothetical protein
MFEFGIKKLPEQSPWRKLNFLTIVYTFFLLICFSLFSFYSNVTNLVFSKDKIDVFKEDLNQIAFYFWNFDKEVSRMIIKIDELVDEYVR